MDLVFLFIGVAFFALGILCVRHVFPEARA